MSPGADSGSYREYLIAGIFARTVIFGATITGAGLAEDVKKGIIDRFRSLPMAPSAVLTGRTLSDVVNNVIVLIVMSLTGLVVGWRIRGSFVARELFGNVKPGTPEPAAWPLVHPVAYTMLWSLAILVIFVPLANAQYRRSTSR